MAIALASLAFLAAAAGCTERLVHGRRAWGAAAWFTAMLGTWALLWWLRLPPTPGSAMLAFGLADIAVLVVGVVAVFRLLGAFEQHDDPPSDDDDDDDSSPADWSPRPPHPRLHPRPHGPHPSPHPARPTRPRRAVHNRSSRDSTRDDVAPRNR